MADIEPRVAMLEANIRDMIASLARIEEKQKATATRAESMMEAAADDLADDCYDGFLGRADGRDRGRSCAVLFRARETHAAARQAEANVEFEFYETYVGLYSITTEIDCESGKWTSRVTLGHRMADPRGAQKLDDIQLNRSYSSEDEAVEGHAQIAAILRARPKRDGCRARNVEPHFFARTTWGNHDQRQQEDHEGDGDVNQEPPTQHADEHSADKRSDHTAAGE